MWKMDSQVLHIMTISNSIIGVSLLAMPYCFKQCGIILSILILIASSILSRLSCHLLLKSAIMARRRTYEVLAFHTFGSLGKFITEIGIIGFLIGTCIAFFVIMGDLGPTIVAKMTGTKSTETMRTSILMALALFCVLPLGLLRNIDSLSSVCTATIGFYFCLVVKVVAEAVPQLFVGDWFYNVEFWRPAGILQCIPIFSMALSCQTQIFEIYQVVQNPSLEKMNNLIRVAVNICTGVYIFVGTFGYIAFNSQTFTGNILMNLPSTYLSDAIKIGFILSVAFSFPLVIFPCRASLNSLLYKQTYSLHEGTDKYIPESRFKGITFVIIFIPLVIGIMIPNIEFVLGVMGSTIGIMICVIFPATCFICISTKNTNERILAQVMLFAGVLIMVLGTYANLFTTDERLNNMLPTSERTKLDINIPKVIDIPLEMKILPDTPPKDSEHKIQETIKLPDLSQPAKLVEIEKNLARQEPPQPQPPLENSVNIENQKQSEEKPVVDVIKPDVQQSKDEPPDVKKVKIVQVVENRQPQEVPVLPPVINNGLKDDKVVVKPPEALIQPELKQPDIIIPPVERMEIRHEPPQPVEPLELNLDKTEPKKTIEIVTETPILNKENNGKVVVQDVVENKDVIKDVVKTKKDVVVQDTAKRDDSDKQAVDIEAIKKEDKELLEQENELSAQDKINFEVLKTLEKQNEEQQKLVQKLKKVLEDKQRVHVLEESSKQKDMEKQKETPTFVKNEAIKNTDKSNNTKKGESVVDVKLNKENLLPLPIILSNSLNKKDTNAGETKEDNNAPAAKLEQVNSVLSQPESNSPNLKNKEQPNDEQLPVLHREIRSANNVVVGLEKTKNSEKPVHTEKPLPSLIKMDMKLSNPEIVKIKSDLNNVYDRVDGVVIRDLKSYEGKD